MGKGISVGVSDKARKGKKAWIGIDGVARKIKKMWIGIGNVARLFFSGQGQLTYHGVITSLTSARYNSTFGAGLSMKNHALICGGYHNADVDVYDKDLVHSTATSLIRTTAYVETAKAGNYGLVTSNNANIGVFDENLVLTNNVTLSRGRSAKAATSFKNHAVFFGGTGYLSNIDVFDENLVNSVYNLAVARTEAGASFNSKFAIVAGGLVNTSRYTLTVEALDTNFTLVSASDLTEKSLLFAGGNVGDYAIFAGNRVTAASSHVGVHAYDSNLTVINLDSLAVSPYDGQLVRITPLNIDGYAMFWVGNMAGRNTYAVVNAYDDLLVRQTLTAPTNKITMLAGSAVVGDYAIFAGGRIKVDASSYSNSAIAEAYKLV